MRLPVVEAPAARPRDRFRQLVNDVPEIRDHVFAELAHELRRLTNHVEELHPDAVHRREHEVLG